MTVFNMVGEYYFKYKEDLAGCAADFLEKHHQRYQERKIKRIAVFYSVLNRGGVQRVISLLVPIFQSMRCQVILITEKISDEDYYIPEEVKRFVITDEQQALADKGSFIKRYKQLEDILDEEKVDLFLHHGVRHTLFIYDIMLANLKGIYTVAEKHQIFTQGFCDMDDLFWMHLPAFQILDRLVVVSSLDEVYWRTLGIKAFYIENPFNKELVVYDDGALKENIVWVGRLDVFSKQYFDVIEIAELVRQTHPEVKFEIFGSGSHAKIIEFTELIKKRGLEGNICFLGYEIDISQIYKNARIHLVTSAYESFSMTIYESKSLGIPLVMYDLPYLELLKNGLGYISVPNGDIHGIAESICRILENHELEVKLRSEAKLSLRDFSNEKVEQKWAQLFRDIEENVYDDSRKNDEYSLILKTMHKHYAIAQKKYEKLLWDSEQAVVSYHVKQAVQQGKELVICPFGKIGKRVRKMLNEKNIWESHIVDNELARNHADIISMSELKKADCSNYFFVICCEDEVLKKEFSDQLREITDENNIVYYDAALD